MPTFTPGRKYSRPDVKELAGLPRGTKGGVWDTGVVEHQGEFLIFANVGIPGRTGHDYGNSWENGLLRWYHKAGSHRSWPSVSRLLEKEQTVHVFWRNSAGPYFEYAGQAEAVKVSNTTPVEIIWCFDTGDRPDEVPSGNYQEGAVRQVFVNAYERDRAARQACIDHYGASCTVCELKFEDRYGSLGAGFVHVHHLVPLSEIGTDYKINPIEDLRPVCPNCHAMIHRHRPPHSIEDIRRQLRQHDGSRELRSPPQPRVAQPK